MCCSGLLDYERIREDFPIFRERRGLVYLDSAATSQKPRQVIEAVERFYRRSNANVARGLYDLAVEATRVFREAHEAIAKFLGARSWEEVVLTANTSTAISTLAYSLLASGFIERGSKIVVTLMEHHSNMLPWRTVARIAGARVEVVPVKSNGRLDLNALERAVDERTRVVAVTHASNVLGYVNPVREIARIAHRYGAIVVVDGAQSVPHMRVDVKLLEADALAFSGHKMLGPSGTGGLWVRGDLLEDLEPGFPAGGTVEEVHYTGGEIVVKWAKPPWRFEPGTPHVAGAAGLIEAIRYLQGIGMDRVEAHERALLEYAVKRLSEVPGVDLVSKEVRDRLGIVAFTVRGYKPQAVAMALSMYGIAVRAGYHCAQPLHEALGLREGSVRASFYIYNGPDDIDKLAEALEYLTRRGLSSAAPRANPM
jgi:cysteine desulfurase/selenocysteine lyase